MNLGDRIACSECGSNEFKLTRVSQGQIIAECSKCEHPHLVEGGTANDEPVILFWDPEKERPERVESTKQRIPEEVRVKSVEELAHEMMEFVEKESLDDVPFHEVGSIFWRKKGLDLFVFGDPDITLKRVKVEARVIKKLEEVELKKHKSTLYSIKPKIMEKARKHDLKKLTETDIELFLMEYGITLSRSLKRMLRTLANLELKQAS